MSIADESQVPHRPPQFGDRVELRLQGDVIRVDDNGRVLVVSVDELGTTIAVPAESAAILRDIPRYEPGTADHPTPELIPRLPIED